jgi:predicted porin
MAGFCQSSVTIYGLLDVSLNYQKFNSSPTKAATHINTVSSDSSYYGFRGVEDLGGGLAAYFKLESGINVDSGTQTSATQYFNRESYVGLRSDGIGSVQLGSQYAPAVWATLKTDPFFRRGVGENQSILQGSRGYPSLYNNSVQYITPNWSGFVGRLLLATGEGAVTGRGTAGSVEYIRGPVTLEATYDTSPVTGASVGLATFPALSSKTGTVSGIYDFGFLRLHALLQRNRTDRLPKTDGAIFGATVPVFDIDSVRMSYISRRTQGSSVKLYALAYLHPISKRTTLLAGVARTNNKGSAAFGIAPSRTEATAIGYPGAGQDASAIQLGIRHLF